MPKSIRTALGNGHLIHVELGEALSISLTGRGDPPPPTALVTEPERVTIQHILISFARAGTKASRTRDDAATLAEATSQRAREGEDVDGLFAASTGDSALDIYTLANTIVTKQSGNEYSCRGTVPAFSCGGFSYGAGDSGTAAYDSAHSPIT